MSENNMKVEDRLAQRLKSEEFGAWFGDEDLHELIKTALDKAFFSERKVRINEYRDEYKPSKLVELAETQLTGIIEAKIGELLAERLAANPSLLDDALKTVAETSPEVFVELLMNKFMERAATDVANSFSVAIQSFMMNISSRQS